MELRLQKKDEIFAAGSPSPPPIRAQANFAPRSVVSLGHLHSPTSRPSELGVFGKLVVWSLTLGVMGAGAVYWNGLVDAGINALSDSVFSMWGGLRRSASAY